MALNANSVLVFSANRGGKSVVRFLGSSANVIVTGNSTVNADITDTTQQFANDQIKSCHLSGAWWTVTGNSTAVGSIAVARVVNSSVTSNALVLSGSGYLTRDNEWPGDRQNPTSNVLVTFSAAATGVLYLEFYKQYDSGDSLIEHQ